MPTTTESPRTGSFMPVAAQSGETLQLAMQELLLTGRILPVGAHLLVRHSFRSDEKKMLEVIYSFVLPRDAALRRFEVRGQDFAVHSALKPVQKAVEEYEKGVAAGHLSTLARQYRDGLVSLSLGNLRPGEEVTVTLEILAGVDLRDDGFRFRFPFTLAPSYHSQARAAEVNPGEGEIELPADLFGDLLLPGFRKSAEGLHLVGFDLALEMPWEVEEIASPSHALRIGKSNRVCLAPASDLPDRDLVLDVQARQSGARVLAGDGEDGRRHFSAVIPSTGFGSVGDAPRTVVLLLDRSGSMSGTPLSQARKAAAACLAVLGPEDTFGIVAFDDQCELFRAALEKANPDNRAAAEAFLNRIDARGGTELAAGIRAAAHLLPDSGGDVFILTDGQVFATEDILESARATGCRLHSLGIGSASQDRFLTLLSRETNGISRFVTPRERVDRAALELFASVARPVATEIQLTEAGLPGGTISPDPPKSAFTGTPVLIFGDCDPNGAGHLAVTFKGAGGPESLQVAIGKENNAAGETLRLIRGARLITDAEAHLGAESEREKNRWNEYLTRLSEQYSLASRSMALVAVVERAGDRPGEPPKTRIVPVGLPQDMQFEGVFGDGAQTTRSWAAPSAPPASRAFGGHFVARMRGMFLEGDSDDDSGSYSCYEALEQQEYNAEPLEAAAAPEPEAAEFDRLMDLSIRLQPDGGMPGRDVPERILATILALLAFLAHGHDLRSGAFRMHVKRMLDYLDSALPATLAPAERETARRAVQAAKTGRSLPGDWLGLALAAVDSRKGAAGIGWQEMRAALA